MKHMSTWPFGTFRPLGRYAPIAACLLSTALAAPGCEDKPAANVAPESSALAPAKPAAMGARTFSIEKASSNVDFLMDAPVEKIRGKLPGTAEGDLQIDLEDISKSTGVITIDIDGLEVYQTKADEKTGKFGDETKSDTQNEHVRNWLEISKDTEEKKREQNRKVQFSIKSIEVTGEKNVMKLTGAERKVTLKAKGDFLLHGHKTEKVADLEATFKFEGDKPVSVSVKTGNRVPVNLAEHDVKPRDAIGKLLAKTLDDLSPKVAKEANVSIEFQAKMKGEAPNTPAKTTP